MALESDMNWRTCTVLVKMVHSVKVYHEHDRCSLFVVRLNVLVRIVCFALPGRLWVITKLGFHVVLDARSLRSTCATNPDHMWSRAACPFRCKYSCSPPDLYIYRYQLNMKFSFSLCDLFEAHVVIPRIASRETWTIWRGKMLTASFLALQFRICPRVITGMGVVVGRTPWSCAGRCPLPVSAPTPSQSPSSLR